MLFGKTGEDSIYAELLVYVADSAYHQANNGAPNFNTFTGLYLFFDIGQHFQTGINMVNGEPMGRVKSISNQGSPGGLDDRTETDPNDCMTLFSSILVPCPVAFTCVGYEVLILEYEQCNSSGGGGGGNGGNTGNTGGNTGGSTGGGGGTSGGNNNGGCTPSPSMSYWDLFSCMVPVEVFIQNGGALPTGFDATLFQQLIAIQDFYNLNQQQITWLLHHPGAIPVIAGTMSAPPVGEGGTSFNVRAVLNFAMMHGLNAGQYQFLLYNGVVFQAIQTFLIQHPPGDSKAVEIVRALLVFVQNLADLTLSELNFLYDNFDGIEEATSEPINPLITATRLICADILNFATLIDEQNTFPYTGMHLTDGYYGFTIPGFGPQTQFHIRDMHMIVNANSTNNSCLPSTASMAADAINLAVSQTQQLFNGLPPNPPSPLTKSSLKAMLLRSMDREFRNAVISCNSVYTSSMYVYAPSQSNPGDGLPVNNIDVKSPACP